jgi:hypothetical protein
VVGRGSGSGEGRREWGEELSRVSWSLVGRRGLTGVGLERKEGGVKRREGEEEERGGKGV